MSAHFWTDDEQFWGQRPRRRPPMTEVEEKPIEPGPDQCCDCKDRCTTRRCSCRKWGFGCQAKCGCGGRDPTEQATACNNVFNHNHIIFGADHNLIAAHPCFVTATEERMKKGDGVKHFPRKELEEILLADTDTFKDVLSEEVEDLLTKWLAKLKTLESGTAERYNHMSWLFRHALGESREWDVPFWNTFFSFCNKAWDDRWDQNHCSICEECVDRERSWHCGNCGECNGGWMQPCDCGGISMIMHGEWGQ